MAWWGLFDQSIDNQMAMMRIIVSKYQVSDGHDDDYCNKVSTAGKGIDNQMANSNKVSIIRWPWWWLL